MVLFHLSDLHLGKRVNDFSMIEDQDYILKVILAAIDEEKPNGIIIAGDIYDRTIPPEEAIKLWDGFLVSLVERGIPVYAISGNHDSAIRFAAYSDLIESTGVHLSPSYDGKVKVISPEDEYGPVNIYLLPFVKPQNVRLFFPDSEINNYTDALRVVIEEMEINPDERNILVAHQYVTGATRCESEEIVVGGLDNVDSSVFDSFDYVALGHLHGKQSAGRPEVRYSGTPLKYSFSEEKHKKSITVLELGKKGKVKVREIPLVPKRDLRTIKGKYNTLVSKEFYEGTNVEDYIHVILTDEDDVPEAMGKLRTVYPNIMKLSYENKRTKSNQSLTNIKDAEKKTPLEILEEFYEKQNNQPMNHEQRAFSTDMISSIWEE